jgi:predicted CXXCH cytochrome family protein
MLKLVTGAVLLAACFTLIKATAAFAWGEPDTLTSSGCIYCHPRGDLQPPEAGDCDSCHADYQSDPALDGYVRNAWYGPHYNYSNLTDKCQTCHSVHKATGDSMLQKSTIHDLCMMCHDGTGGYGVYGTVKARTGADPGGGHRIDTTNTIPGGDPVTGGDATRTFAGVGGDLTCTDCHAPHNTNTVKPFKGDRRRIRGTVPSPVSTKLLRRRPTGSDVTVTVYGSDWCIACHEGRANRVATHDHPVEHSSTLTPVPYDYGNVPILLTSGITSATTMGPVGGVNLAGGEPHWSPETTNSGNRAYLMPVPRTPQQQGHGPICQQCHEDSRFVGTLSSSGTTAEAAPATITAADGVAWNSGSSTWTVAADNPLIQNFPHETQNPDMLVERDDSLCLNCHPADLP